MPKTPTVAETDTNPEGKKGSWQFDWRDAIRLLMGARKRRYHFEREVMLMLLLVWMLWPKNRSRLLSAARLVASVITFTPAESWRVAEAQDSDARWLRAREDIRTRLGEEWYMKFYDEFFLPLGGLPSQMFARSRGSLSKLMSARWEALRLELDMLDIVVRVAQWQPNLATRATAVACVSRNFYNIGDFYGISHDAKRQTAWPVAVSTAGNRWDKALATIVFLYAFQHCMPSLFQVDLESRLLLPEVRELRKGSNFSKIFRFYECVMQTLEDLPNKPKAALQWRLYHFPETANESELPKLADEEKVRILKILAHKDAPAGTRMKKVAEQLLQELHDSQSMAQIAGAANQAPQNGGVSEGTAG